MAEYLREQVALKLGWRRATPEEISKHWLAWVSPTGEAFGAVNDYPSSFVACEEVLAWLMGNGWNIILQADETGWMVGMMRNGDQYHSQATTLPLALCRAFVQIGETP